MSCGPTCLRIVARHFGRTLAQREAEELTYQGRQGVSMLSICDAAETLGLRAMPVRCDMAALVKGGRTPFIAHWDQNHFIVVHKIAKGRVHVSDPAASGLISYSIEEFNRHWATGREGVAEVGIATFFEVTQQFRPQDRSDEEGGSWRILRHYLHIHRSLFVQLCVGTLIATLLLFVPPFLMRSLVDEGVGRGDPGFVTVFLIAQGCLILAGVAMSLIRGWLLLYLSARISIELVSNFLQAMMRLPMRFFDRISSGDLMQRLEDHRRVEHFLTSNALESVFSLAMLLVYAPIIAAFSLPVFGVFVMGTFCYLAWVMLFLAARRRIDDRRFAQLSRSRASEIELIQAIAEIKLTGSEKQKRWAWESIQARLFELNVDGMKLEQAQQAGAGLINSATLAVCSALAAWSVIDGSITLGTMLAITVMLGQMNGPLASFVRISHDAQDALLSLRRMNDLQSAEPEDVPGRVHATVPEGDIVLHDVSFRYGNPNGSLVLDHVNLTIPQGSTTAIVGASGSGKTSLLKLLLKFYDPEAGRIMVGGTDLRHVAAVEWRARCGSVMQDGFLFYDTIARNIAVTDEVIDRERLVRAARIADAEGLIGDLPIGYNTRIGPDGLSLSGGQAQRILIARAIYRGPAILLLDEATSALDANSESIVSRNFEQLPTDMTKIVVAHRLSTVRAADQIVVLDRGRIAEIGTHATLIERCGLYLTLVQNQLELGA